MHGYTPVRTACGPAVSPTPPAECGAPRSAPATLDALVRGHDRSPLPSDPGERDRGNRRLLKAYAASHDPRERLGLRNTLVARNLPLALRIAGRMARSAELPYEDLRQVGSLGLIRAVEAFDPKRKVSLSSFAVPYIEGAIRHELRDRQQLLRIPRPLWERRQKVASLQEQRRRRGLAPLGEGELASALGCPPQELRETLAVGWMSRMRSLDAPLRRSEGDEPGCLLDRLADPASLSVREGEVEAPEEATDGAATARRRWLQGALTALDPDLRTLVVGRLEHGCTWVELGRELGIAPRQAQRRCLAALDRLRLLAQAWQEEAGVDAAASTPAVSPPETG